MGYRRSLDAEFSLVPDVYVDDRESLKPKRLFYVIPAMDDSYTGAKKFI